MRDAHRSLRRNRTSRRATAIAFVLLTPLGASYAQQKLTPQAVELQKQLTGQRYVKCIRDQIGKLDDRVSDARTIAGAAYNTCSQQRQEFYSSDPEVIDWQSAARLFRDYEMDQATRFVLEGRAARR